MLTRAEAKSRADDFHNRASEEFAAGLDAVRDRILQQHAAWFGELEDKLERISEIGGRNVSHRALEEVEGTSPRQVQAVVLTYLHQEPYRFDVGIDYNGEVFVSWADEPQQ